MTDKIKIIDIELTVYRRLCSQCPRDSYCSDSLDFCQDYLDAIEEFQTLYDADALDELKCMYDFQYMYINKPKKELESEE
jgi:hypothetical protein